MRLSRVLTSAAVATSLISAPVVAQAAVADRIGAEAEGEAIAGNSWFVIPAVLLVAIILAVLHFDDDDDDLPNSP